MSKVRRRPPDARLTQACERGESHHDVARPAVIHVAEDDLKLLSCFIQQLGENGALLDLLVLGTLFRLLVPADNLPSLLLGELLKASLLLYSEQQRDM